MGKVLIVPDVGHTHITSAACLVISIILVVRLRIDRVETVYLGNLWDLWPDLAF